MFDDPFTFFTLGLIVGTFVSVALVVIRHAHIVRRLKREILVDIAALLSAAARQKTAEPAEKEAENEQH